MEKTKKTKGIKKGRGVFIGIGLALLIVYSVSFLTPLLWTFMSSLRNDFDFGMSPFSFVEGEKLYFENYKWVFANMTVPAYKLDGYQGVLRSIGDIYIEEQFYNSLCYTLICTLTHTLTPCICAYAVAKYNFKFGRFIYGIVIVTMVMPTIGNLASEIQIAQALGFYDSLFGVAIMKGHFLGTNFLIYYAAFKSLPNDYKEAAEMDGASQLQVFLTISLPLIKTTISTIALLSFISYWNDYNTAMIYLPSKPTVAYGLFYFSNSAQFC